MQLGSITAEEASCSLCRWMSKKSTKRQELIEHLQEDHSRRLLSSVITRRKKREKEVFVYREIETIVGPGIKKGVDLSREG